MPKIVNHDEYRNEILEKCFDLSGRKGFSNVTMKEIAAEIGVSTGTLYHYFSAKDNILGELIAWAGARNVSEYMQKVQPIDNINDRFNVFIDFLKEHGGFFRNIILLSIDMYRAADIKDCQKVYKFFSEQYTGVMFATLNISEQFAHSLFMYFVGIIYHTVVYPEVKEYHRQIDMLASLLRPLVVDPTDDREQNKNKLNELIGIIIKNTFVSARELLLRDYMLTVKKKIASSKMTKTKRTSIKKGKRKTMNKNLYSSGRATAK